MKAIEQYCSPDMENVLYCINLYGHIEGDEIKPVETSNVDNRDSTYSLEGPKHLRAKNCHE